MRPPQRRRWRITVSEGDAGIVIIGSHAPGLLVDVAVLPRPGETVMGKSISSPPDGGKGSNQALAAAALGGEVAFVGRVGEDELGNSLVALMRARGIDIRHLSRSATASTGCGINIVDDRGVPEMIVIPGANDELDAAHVDEAFDTFQRPRVVLTQMEIQPRVALHAARLGKRLGAVSIVNAAPATAWPFSPEESADVVDILVVNEIEAEMLDRRHRHDDPALPLPERLAGLVKAASVIVTLGERGLDAFDRGEAWRLDAVQVPVVDTSGAGDVFCAALAVAVAEGVGLRRACSWAGAAAAMSVTRPGTIPSFPTREMVGGFPTGEAAA
jgi:ribokinase